MTIRRWLWVILGLLAWAVIAVVWMTGPYDCSTPDNHGHVVCKG